MGDNMISLQICDDEKETTCHGTFDVYVYKSQLELKHKNAVFDMENKIAIQNNDTFHKVNCFKKEMGMFNKKQGACYIQEGGRSEKGITINGITYK